MGQYIVIFDDDARKEIRAHHKSGDRATIRKLEAILQELTTHPYSGTGQPERLKYDLKGFWSRRLNRKDRIIYKVEEDIVTVLVIAAMGHDDDK